MTAGAAGAQWRVPTPPPPYDCASDPLDTCTTWPLMDVRRSVGALARDCDARSSVAHFSALGSCFCFRFRIGTRGFPRPPGNGRCGIRVTFPPWDPCNNPPNDVHGRALTVGAAGVGQWTWETG